MNKLDKIVNNNSDKERLKSDFFEAKKNQNFSNYIDLLNIHEDILMKYTSQLEDCCVEFKNCSNCKSIEGCKNKIQGYILTPEKNDNTIKFTYKMCNKLKKLNETNSYKKNILLFDVPKNVSKASLKEVYLDDKNRSEIIMYFKEFSDEYKRGRHPKGIYLHGNFGSGKTYLIAALFNELAKKNISSVIIYFPEFLRSIKESFNNSEIFKEKFNIVKKTPLLLIDDIGAENLSTWARDEILSSILQYRMDEDLPTFFTSNLNLEELEDHFSFTSNNVDKVKARRLIERIKYLTIEKKLISKNRRNSL